MLWALHISPRLIPKMAKNATVHFGWHIGMWAYTLFRENILFFSYGAVLSNASKMHLQILVSSRKLEHFFLVAFVHFTN